MLEKVPPMAPMVFSTLGKAATPRETPTKETPLEEQADAVQEGPYARHHPRATRQEAMDRLTQQ